MTEPSPNQAEILSQVIQLYEFSLAIGNYSNLHDNCQTFFDRILAKRNLSYAALWMREPVHIAGSDFHLAYSDPQSEYLGPKVIPFDTPMIACTQELQIQSILRSDIPQLEWIDESHLPNGDSYTFIDLPGIGFVVLAGYGDRAIWQPWQLNQMVPIFKSFAASVMSNIHFQQLQVEIGERKVAEQQANEANKIKGEFLANMSHELRTPLNAVLGMSQLLEETSLDGEQKELVSTILSSGKSLLELINSILDFTKLEAQKVALEQIPFNLREVLQGVYQTFRKDCARKNLSYVMQIDEGAPVALLGDPLRLKQILLNLVSNAVKFTRKGGISIDANVLARENEDVVIQLVVKDSGIGIEPRHMDTLFDSFHQVDSSITRKFGGTGLGLSICKQLTELMNGTIDVKSSFHEGSEFLVTLPLKVSRIVEQATVEASRPINPGQKPSVLLVEDDRVNQMVANKLLGKLGCEVDIAATGSEAVERLKQQQYDLVFMDMQMPEMDGIEATRHIRNHQSGVLNPDITILAMTANATEADRKHCLESGMNDFLTKPIDKQVLDEKLKAWIPSTLASKPD